MENMNLFGSVEHNDDNTDKWHDICENPTSNDMLDYMTLIIARYLACDKALKGGYMLNQLIPLESRLTHDIDFSIMKEEYYGSVKKYLQGIGDYFIRKGIIANYKIKDSISSTSSGGIDMYDGDGRKILGVDVGLHNLLYGTTNYEIKIGDVNAFKVERMLSDKILAILSRKRFRRTKDLYDLFILATHFDFSYEELIKCITSRDNYDSTVWDNIPFGETVLLEYKKAWDKLNLVSATTSDTLFKPDFNNCLHLFNIIAFAIKDNYIFDSWDHKSLCWRK